MCRSKKHNFWLRIYCGTFFLLASIISYCQVVQQQSDSLQQRDVEVKLNGMIAADTTDAGLYFMEGILYQERRQFANSIPFLEKSLYYLPFLKTKKEPLQVNDKIIDSVLVLRALAISYDNAGKVSEAIAAYAECKKKDTDLFYVLAKGNVLVHHNFNAEAIKYYDSIKPFIRPDVRLFNGEALAYFQKKKLKKADDLADKSLQQFPDNIAAYKMKGMIATAESKIDEACLYYERALALYEKVRAKYPEHYFSDLISSIKTLKSVNCGSR